MSRETKYCRKCYKHKSILEFGRKASSGDGRQLQCKACARAYELSHRYDLTVDQFETMANTQANGCAICGNECKLYVDHDHSTSGIRGLLCNRCNIALGGFRDSPELLYQAALYLEGSYESTL